MEEENILKWHGFKGNKDWKLPKLVASSVEAARADQGNTIKANEYLDSDDVLVAKMKVVADLVKKSKLTVAYTGAGLSKASGIPDYATKSKETVVKAPKIKNWMDAEPTYAHCVITHMERAGFIKHYVQQNHDGLPQKSGFPQEKINEIHGAWYDPSNPVVQFGGNLRGDLFDWMAKVEKKTDLTLCLGTSLSGMNADRMAKTPAKLSLQNPPKALGTVIINLQQTTMDSKCAIRVWARLDDAFKLLAENLGITNVIKPIPRKIPPGDVFIVPYNEKGIYDPTCRLVWDLSPKTKHIIPVEEAMNFNSKVSMHEKNSGHYSMGIQEPNSCIVSRLMGNWWVDVALRGAIDQLPIINENPQVTKNHPPYKYEDDPNLPIKLPKSLKIIQGYEKAEDVNNQHKWSLRLNSSAESVVEKVVYKLHPTFFPSTMESREPPFKIERYGWGTFVVNIIITLKEEAQTELKIIEAEHQLKFEDGKIVTKVPLV